MKKLSATIAVAFVLVSLVPAEAVADLIRRDANDVGFRLDVQRSASVSTADRLGLGVSYYDRIAKRRQPRVRVLFDSFGGPRPDFVLRFHYLRYSPHDFRLACDFVRLADRRHLDVSPPDDQPAYMYCDFARPRRMVAGRGIRWRVVAVMPGSGRDAAPNEGWYPHA
jgi:hypothetical protein